MTPSRYAQPIRYARLADAPMMQSHQAPLEFERYKLEPGQRRKISTPRPTCLYRGLKLRFDPLSRDVLVHALSVDEREGLLLAPTSALVLAESPPWMATLDISQRYVLDVENRGPSTLDMLAWCEGVYVE